MRWPAFLILIYLTISVQLGVGGFVNCNLVLPVVVFIAINARREEALLMAFALGGLQDLFTQQPLGLYAFCYGLVGLFIVGAQPAVYRDHPLTHFTVTLAAALLTGMVVLFNEWACVHLHSLPDGPGSMVGQVLVSAFYTALVSPILLGILVRIKPVFGFRPSRLHPGLAGQSRLIYRQ